MRLLNAVCSLIALRPGHFVTEGPDHLFALSHEARRASPISPRRPSTASRQIVVVASSSTGQREADALQQLDAHPRENFPASSRAGLPTSTMPGRSLATATPSMKPQRQPIHRVPLQQWDSDRPRPHPRSDFRHLQFASPLDQQRGTIHRLGRQSGLTSTTAALCNSSAIFPIQETAKTASAPQSIRAARSPETASFSGNPPLSFTTRDPCPRSQANQRRMA